MLLLSWQHFLLLLPLMESVAVVVVAIVVAIVVVAIAAVAVQL